MALDFDMNEYNSADSLEPVPPGIYRVKVVHINAKPAFADFDERRNYDIELEIIEGEHKGHLLSETLTLYNGKSEKQTHRSRSRLKNLAWACYLPSINGVDDLQNRELKVEVWINEGIDRETGEKRWKRRNQHAYVVPDDFSRPGTKPKPAPDPLPNDDIPF
jgi:Protein of unknown function (DUF669)